MLGSLWRRLLRVPAATAKMVDPWFGSGGTYIGELRTRGILNQIAAELSVPGHAPVRVQFNRELTRAEYHQDGKLLAWVKVHGEGGQGGTYETVVVPVHMSEEEASKHFSDKGLKGVKVEPVQEAA